MVSVQPDTQDEAEPSACSLFTHLPDSHTQIFPQDEEPRFSTFTRFGDLPQELRLIILKAAMPKRTVQVELSMSHEILHSHTPPPSLLRVNREARLETSKYYIPLLKSSKRRPILFNPQLDTIYFHRRKNKPLLFLASMEYVTRDSVDAIAKIQSLKITDMFYGGAMKCWVLFGVARRLLYGEGTHPHRGGLRFFSGLRELVLVTANRARDLRFDVDDHRYGFLHAEKLDNEELIEECRREFQGYFEWEREWNRDCRVPQVVVKQGRQARLDKWYLGRLDEEPHG